MKFMASCLTVLLTCTLAAQTPLALQVVSVSPRGTAASEAENQRLVVTFDQPVAPLAGLSGQPMTTGPLTLAPPVAGTFRWLGTASLEFRPDKPLPLATKFTVTIPAGVKAASGAVLAQAYTWSFETSRPKVIGSLPQQGAKWISLDAEVYLRFDQPVNLAAAANFVTIASGAAGSTQRGVPAGTAAQKIPFTTRLPTDEEMRELSTRPRSARTAPASSEIRQEETEEASTAVVLIPKSPLPVGQPITVTVQAGMPSLLGPLGTAAPFVLKFSTAEAFRLKDWQPKEPVPPLANLIFQFTNPVSVADLIKHLRFDPAITIPEYYSTWDWYQAELNLSFYFPPDTTITFTIDAGLPDQFGNKLGKAVTGKITTTGFPPQMRFSAGPGIVEADGQRRVPIEGMNLSSVDVRMKKLAADEIIPLLNHDDIFYNAAAVAQELPVQKSILFGRKRNFWHLRPVELQHALTADTMGVVFVQIHAPEAGERQYYAGLYQVTHLGITGKFSPANNLVFVTHMKDAAPVAGASVEVRNDNNQVLWTGATDAEGRCETPGWAALNVAAKSQWEPPRLWVFVRQNADLAFLHSEWGTGIYPYRFGIDYEWNPQPLTRTGVVMTDRGLYRAGETVYFKGILREKGGDGEWQPPPQRAWQWRIEDARNQEVVSKTIQLSDYGAFDDSLKLDKSAALGLYWMTLSAPADPNTPQGEEFEDRSGVLATGSFRVEAFRAAEFAVTALATNVVHLKRGYLAGEAVTAKISARYLFGSPLRQAPVKWRMQLTPAQFESERFVDYTFWQWRAWSESQEHRGSELLASGDDSLDANGEIAIQGQAIPTGVPGMRKLLIEGEVTSASGQALAGRTAVPVHPAEFYLGLRTAGYFFPAHRAVACSVIAVSPEDRLLSDRSIRMRVVQRQWHAVRKAGVGGRYSWETTVEDTPVDSGVITSGSKVLAYAFTPQKSGYYIVEAQANDRRGQTAKSAVFLYVSGADYVAWERGDDDRIELVPDRRRYRPGDNATLMVQSPFEKCRALVTIERESIFESRIVELAGTAPTIQIPIKENYLPNVFVSVALLQGRTGNQTFSKEGEDLGKPQFKIGYTNLTVDPGTRHLSLKVKSDRRDYRPGETVRISVDVGRAGGRGAESEITLAVVDVGVLSLIGYGLPDPFGDFYGPRPLSVRTSETLLHLIEQRNYGEKSEATGGGGAFEDIALRSDFKTTPLWLPALRTDAGGHAEAQFKLPGNLTMFRIMAVAHTRDSKFGNGSAEFRVNKPLLLQAALPRFARAGDRLEGGVVVTNATSQRAKVSLQMQARGVAALGDSLANFELAPGESRAIRKPFAAQGVGEAAFQFRARMQNGKEDFSDGLAAKIPISVPQTREVVATSGSTENRALEKLNIPANIFPNAGTLELAASSTAMVGLRESVNYLFEYPYGCLEQRTSRVLPMILAGDLVEAFALPALQQGNYRSAIKEYLEELPRYQTNDGGFSLWAGSPRSWDYITALTLYTMAQAQKNNFEVNHKLLKRVREYANEQLRAEYSADQAISQRSFNYTRALLLHALVLSGEKPDDYLTFLFENRGKVSLDGQCHLLRAAALRKKTAMVTALQTELMNKIKIAPTTAHFEDLKPEELWWCYYSTARTTALCLQALLETKATFPHADKAVRWLMDERKMGRWRTTQENSSVFEALTAFFRAYEKEIPDFTAEIRVAGESILQEAFQGRTTDVRRAEAGLNRFTAQKDLPIEIAKSGPGRLYYGLRMAYYPLQAGPTRDEGLAIQKTIERAETTNGQSGASYRPGEVVQIVLRVITAQERHFVVIDDPLPAGFEAINPRLLTTSSAHQDENGGEGYGWWRTGFDHVEKHDDRVLLFATWLPAGEHVYKYQARATTPGNFTLPSTHGEEMYTPEVFGRFQGGVIEIR